MQGGHTVQVSLGTIWSVCCLLIEHGFLEKHPADCDREKEREQKKEKRENDGCAGSLREWGLLMQEPD